MPFHNNELCISSAYKIIYDYSKDEKYFKNSLNLINEILINEYYSPKNSLFIRAQLCKMELYITKIKNDPDSAEIIDSIEIDESISLLHEIFKQVEYEKYKYTYYLLRYELQILMEKENMILEDKIKIKKCFLEIKDKTINGNLNISFIAESKLNKYKDFFSI